MYNEYRHKETKKHSILLRNVVTCKKPQKVAQVVQETTLMGRWANEKSLTMFIHCDTVYKSDRTDGHNGHSIDCACMQYIMCLSFF